MGVRLKIRRHGCLRLRTILPSTPYVHDVEAVTAIVKSREPSLPVFMLGHSAGGVVACLYTLDHPAELAGLICESFAHELPAPDFALAVFKGLSHIAPHAHVLHLPNERFSRDPEAVEAMNNDPLIAHETQPTQTLAAMVRADERVRAWVSPPSTPLYLGIQLDERSPTCCTVALAPYGVRGDGGTAWPKKQNGLRAPRRPNASVVRVVTRPEHPSRRESHFPEAPFHKLRVPVPSSSQHKPARGRMIDRTSMPKFGQCATQRRPDRRRPVEKLLVDVGGASPAGCLEPAEVRNA
jgi:pimeloyl-ACP methyl ester carboxylesterase